MRRNLEEFNNKHKDTPCVIIASGPSVIEADLSKLKPYVTIAVNSGYVAYPDATYFVSDDFSVVRWSYFVDDLRKSKTTIALLYEDKLAGAAAWFGNRAVLFRHRTGYNITDYYDHDNYQSKICQSRTSLGTAIGISHIMMCNPIIIVGLDCYRLNGVRWFWQLPEWENKPHRVDRRNEDTYSNKSDNTDDDLDDILKYWQDHGEEINQKCKVYNASEKSRVTVFPYMSLNDFLEKYHV